MADWAALERMLAADERAARAQGAVRTHEEVAAIMGISKQAVEQTEKRALRKLRRHPLMRELAKEADLI